MKEKVLLAARFCGEIDDDAEYMEYGEYDSENEYTG